MTWEQFFKIRVRQYGFPDFPQVLDWFDEWVKCDEAQA